MAGLYDRMHPTGLDGLGADRVDNHLVAEAISAIVSNTFSRNQVIDAINEDLANLNAQELRTEDIADIDAIIAVIEARGTNTQKLIYGITQMTPVFYASGRDLIPEASWRAALEI